MRLLFGVIAVTVACAAIVVSISVYYAHTRVETIIRQTIPALELVQKTTQAIEEANTVLLLNIAQNNLLQSGEQQEYEVRYYNALERYLLYQFALLWGTDSSEFTEYAGGILPQMWKAAHMPNTHYSAAPVLLQSKIESMIATYRTYIQQSQNIFNQLRQVQNNPHSEQEYLNQLQRLHSDIQMLQQTQQIMLDEITRMTVINSTLAESATKQITYARIPVFIAILVFTIIVMFVVILSIRMHRSMVLRPIHALTKSAKEFANGKYSERTPVYNDDEIGILATTFNTMAQTIEKSHNTLAHQVAEKTEELSQKIADSNDQRKAMLNIIEDFEESRLSLLESKQNLEYANTQIQEQIKDVQRFKEALDASTNAIAIINTEKVIMYANAAWYSVTGTTFESSNNTIADILQYSSKEITDQYTHAIETKTPFSSDEFLCKRRDTPYYAKVTLYPVTSHDNIEFFVHMHEDATEQKKIEQAKSEFVSLASHQLRTPLTALRWILDMFTKGKLGLLNDKQTEMMNDAMQCANTMADTVGAMLMLSRIEAGKVHMNIHTTTLRHIWEQAWSNSKSSATLKNIQLTTEIDTNAVIETDATLLHEVVQNLLSNAVKYTPIGGTIHVKMNVEQEQCTIQIADSGYGIPEAEQEKIFSKFFRATNVLEKETEGTGLGLYLVHSLTTLLQGSISFTSQMNIGTTFTVTIPTHYHE